MDRIIRADLYRHNGLTGTKGFLRGLMLPGFRYMFLLRKASKYYKYSIVGIFYRLLISRYKYKYGFQIPTATKIGEGFYIPHFGSIVINPNVIIGSNCNIAHGVTIGRTNRGKLKGFPVIGDKVWIGTGSVIVGNIHIGSNVLIAPNSFVNIDVPDNSIAIGNPVKIIKKDDPTEGYINFILK